LQKSAIGAIKRFYATVKNHDSDPLPSSLILASVGLSFASLWMGVALDAGALVVNVISNLVLLGPGLIVTNYVVKHIRDKRMTSRVVPQLTLLSGILGGISGVVIDLNERLKVGIPADLLRALSREAEADVADLGSLARLNGLLQSVVRHMPLVGDFDIPDYDSRLAVTERMMNMPPMILVERIVERIDAMWAVPESYIIAVQLKFVYESVNFSGIIWLGETPDTRIYDVYKGFDGFKRTAREYSVPQDGDSSPFLVDPWQYYRFVRNVTGGVTELLTYLAQECPVGVRSRMSTQ
jgi:hypothetical protein